MNMILFLFLFFCVFNANASVDFEFKIDTEGMDARQRLVVNSYLKDLPAAISSLSQEPEISTKGFSAKTRARVNMFRKSLHIKYPFLKREGDAISDGGNLSSRSSCVSFAAEPPVREETASAVVFPLPLPSTQSEPDIDLDRVRRWVQETAFEDKVTNNEGRRLLILCSGAISGYTKIDVVFEKMKEGKPADNVTVYMDTLSEGFFGKKVLAPAIGSFTDAIKKHFKQPNVLNVAGVNLPDVDFKSSDLPSNVKYFGRYLKAAIRKSLKDSVENKRIIDSICSSESNTLTRYTLHKSIVASIKGCVKKTIDSYFKSDENVFTNTEVKVSKEAFCESILDIVDKVFLSKEYEVDPRLVEQIDPAMAVDAMGRGFDMRSVSVVSSRAASVASGA